MFELHGMVFLVLHYQIEIRWFKYEICVINIVEIRYFKIVKKI